MADSIMRERSKLLARKIVPFCRYLRENGVEYALVNQALRSGTSVGANLHEAQYAQGTKDFISKIEIALKECNETDYWLELIGDTTPEFQNECLRLRKDCIELRRMMVAAVTTLKKT